MDKRVLITGAQRGIGADITRVFAQEGCRLVLQMPQVCPAMRGLVGEIEGLTELRVFSCDPSGHSDAMQRLTRAALAAYDGLDVIVNHVGLSASDLGLCVAAAEDAAVEARVTELLTMPCLMSAYGAEIMGRQQAGGVILNVSTLEAGVAPEQLAFYALVLSRLETMTRALAERWSARGVRVHGLAPATTLYRAGGEAATSEIARTAVYLAGPSAEFLNGTLIAVDNANVPSATAVPVAVTATA